MITVDVPLAAAPDDALLSAAFMWDFRRFYLTAARLLQTADHRTPAVTPAAITDVLAALPPGREASPSLP